MTVGVTGYSFDGTDLRDYALNVETLGDEFPGVRGPERVYSARHGATVDGRYPYRPRQVTLSMVVMPRSTTGTVDYASTVQHEQENLDALKALFHRRSGYSTLTKTLADGSSRTLEVRVLDPIRFSRARTGVWRGAVVLRTGYPFWAGAAQSYAGRTANFTAANGGNAPVNNMTVTFNTAGRVTVDGDWIESSVSNLVVDVGARTAKVGSTDRDDALSANSDWWLELQPGNNTVAVSGGANVDLAYNDGWL